MTISRRKACGRFRFVSITLCLVLGALASSSQAADILMIGNDPGPTFGDDLAVFDHLSEVLGHEVLYLAGGDAVREDGEGVDLIVVSSTLGSGTVRGKFTGLSTPMLNWEEAIMDGTTAAGNLAMGTGSENGTANQGTQIRIVNPAHPLAAGLTGLVDLATDPIPRPYISGSVAPGVLSIALLPEGDVGDVVLAPSGTGMHIGSNQGGGSPFSGLMDEVAIWDRALTYNVNANNELTGGEALAVFAQGVPALDPSARAPIAYWPFDDVGDQFTAIDASGNGFDATLEGGASKVADDVAPNVGGSGALALDGSGLVDVFEMERPGGELTYSFWFKPDSGVYGDDFDTADPRVDFFYGNGQGGTVRPHLSANRNGRPVGLYVATDAGDLNSGQIEATTSAFSSDEWHHVLMTWDGVTGSTFVDGVLNNQVELGGSNSLFAITAVEAGGLLTDGTTSPNRVVNFPIQDIGFASLTEDGLSLFDAAVAWLLSSTPSVPGDFDGDGLLTETDINLLNAEVATGMGAPLYDLNEDGLVDGLDIGVWVVDLKQTWFGDADLDGSFTSADFVQVFQRGKFELQTDATWGDGDWTGDLRFDSGDFVAAFQDGGFELGPRGAVAAVPEPSGVCLALIALAGWLTLRRR